MPDEIKLALQEMADTLAAGDGKGYCQAWDALQAALGGGDPAAARAALVRRDNVGLAEKQALLALIEQAPAGWGKVLMPGVRPCAATKAALADRLALLLAE